MKDLYKWINYKFNEGRLDDRWTTKHPIWNMLLWMGIGAIVVLTLRMLRW